MLVKNKEIIHELKLAKLFNMEPDWIKLHYLSINDQSAMDQTNMIETCHKYNVPITTKHLGASNYELYGWIMRRQYNDDSIFDAFRGMVALHKDGKLSYADLMEYKNKLVSKYNIDDALLNEMKNIDDDISSDYSECETL